MASQQSDWRAPPGVYPRLQLNDRSYAYRLPDTAAAIAHWRAWIESSPPARIVNTRIHHDPLMLLPLGFQVTHSPRRMDVADEESTSIIELLFRRAVAFQEMLFDHNTSFSFSISVIDGTYLCYFPVLRVDSETAVKLARLFEGDVLQHTGETFQLVPVTSTQFFQYPVRGLNNEFYLARCIRAGNLRDAQGRPVQPSRFFFVQWELELVRDMWAHDDFYLFPWGHCYLPVVPKYKFKGPYFAAGHQNLAHCIPVPCSDAFLRRIVASAQAISDAEHVWEDTPDYNAILEMMNEIFGAVASSAAVAYRGLNQQGNDVLILVKQQSFIQSFSHLTTTYMFRAGAKVVKRMYCLAAGWCKYPFRRAFDDVVCLPPCASSLVNLHASQQFRRTLNKWSGFAYDEQVVVQELDAANPGFLQYIQETLAPQINQGDVDIPAIIEGLLAMDRQEGQGILATLFAFLIGHLHFVVAGGYTPATLYLLRYIARLLQYPGQPLGVVLLLFSGDQGVGKGFFFSIILSLIGPRHSCLIDAKSILGDFNSILDSKVYVFMDEFFTGTDDASIEKYERLKSMITEKRVVRHTKYDHDRTEENIVSYGSATNRENIRLDPADRRFYSLPLNTAYLPEPGQRTKRYFDILWAITEQNARLSLSAFACLMYALDVGRFNPQDHPLSDNARLLRAIQTDRSSTDSFTRFIETCVQRKYNVPSFQCMYKGDTHLYDCENAAYADPALVKFVQEAGLVDPECPSWCISAGITDLMKAFEEVTGEKRITRDSWITRMALENRFLAAGSLVNRRQDIPSRARHVRIKQLGMFRSERTARNEVPEISEEQDLIESQRQDQDQRSDWMSMYINEEDLVRI